MSREFHLDEDHALLKLRGITGLLALRFKVAMPYRMIRQVVVDEFEAPRWMLRMPGTSLSWLNIYEGSFLYRNEWYFLSYDKSVPLVIIELEGHPKYRYVIFAIDDPTGTAAELRRRMAAWPG